MAKDDFDLFSFVELIKRQKSIFISIWLGLMIISLVFLAIWPKTYESDSVIQLASIGSGETNELFTPVESKAILETSEILQNGFILYNEYEEIDLSQFIDNHVKVELISENIGRNEEVASYIKLVVSANDPELAKQVNQEIIDSFFVYVVPYYNRTLDVYLKDLEQTNNLISKLEGQITNNENKLSSYSAGNSASDVLLLSRTLLDYRVELVKAQDKQIKIESILANKRAYRIVSPPYLPIKPTSPNVFLALILAAIVNFIIALSFIFLYEN